MLFSEIDRSRVIISDAYLKQRRSANRRYLMSLNSDALVFNFRSEAVLDDPWQVHSTKKPYFGGWEAPASQVRGQFLGHWLSAAAMIYASTGDMEIKAKADSIVSALAECQEANGGEWTASIPEKYFDRMAEGKFVWAPQYVCHKTFMGLLDMYLHAGNAQALEIAINWSKWFFRWTSKFSREEMDGILDNETGGMLEIWGLLYSITKKDEYLTLIERYYRKNLFDSLLAGRDALTNMHANSTIPEAVGAAMVYEVTGEEKYLDIAKAYWKSAVTLRGRYATGGQNSFEAWSPMMKLAGRLGDRTQEHCTVYNMMRLADFLFRATGEKEYADYWEQNLYNGIFAQGYWSEMLYQGLKSDYPHEGLLTYWLPLRGGARKGWVTSATEDFFCCHGTLVQANARLDRGIYYVSNEKPLVIVNQFFNSEFQTEIANLEIQIKQSVEIQNGSAYTDSEGLFASSEYSENPNIVKLVFSVKAKTSVDFELKIRIPFWTNDEPALRINGTEHSPVIDNGYISIAKKWTDDVLIVEFRNRIWTQRLPGRADMVAFMYGPEVLAGLCDGEISLTGDPEKPEDILVPEDEREYRCWSHTFKTTGQIKNIRFVPLRQIGYEQYTVYFPFLPAVQKTV